MRILYISTSDPNDRSYGGAQRCNYIRDALNAVAKVDTVVISRSESSFAELEWNTARVTTISTRYDAGYLECIRLDNVARKVISKAERDNKYDYIVARYFRTARLVPRRVHDKLVIDADDFRQNLNTRSVYARIRRRIRSLLVSRLARRSRHIWLVDPRDRQNLNRATCSMLPNTARRFEPDSVLAARPNRILMVGLYGHTPNREGLAWFAREIFPILRSRFGSIELHAVGKYYDQSLESLGNGVVMRGFVENLGNEYVNSDLVICPIFTGSGTQIKVVEALMNGRPTVVSEFSFQGFSDVLRDGKDLLVARTNDDWVDHISAILEDPAQFESMTAEGQIAAQQHYGIDALRRQVSSTLVDERRSD